MRESNQATTAACSEVFGAVKRVVESRGGRQPGEPQINYAEGGLTLSRTPLNGYEVRAGARVVFRARHTGALSSAPVFEPGDWVAELRRIGGVFLRAAQHPNVYYAASAFRMLGLASEASRAQSWQSHTLTRGVSDQKNASNLTSQHDGRPAAQPLQRGDELFAGVEVTARPHTAVDALAISVRLFGLRFCGHVYHGDKRILIRGR